MRRDRARQSGTILFEVVVGMTILAIAGIAWISLLAQTRASIAKVRTREARMRTASDLLERYRFLNSSEYEARLGTTRIGALAVRVSSVAPHLYGITALDTGTEAVVLTTTVYAREKKDSIR
ncbi:MAG TPA: hypothetical protein VF929_11805 [Gemmatimonadaceae bacterium]